MRDNARMTIAARCHQHSMRQFAAIIKEGISGESGHITIRLPHDQISRGKVPVSALSAGKSGIEAALGDPAKAKRQ